MYGRSSRPYAVRELLDGLRRVAGDHCGVDVDQVARRPSSIEQVVVVVVDLHRTVAGMEPSTRGDQRLHLIGLVDGWAVDQEGQLDRLRVTSGQLPRTGTRWLKLIVLIDGTVDQGQFDGEVNGAVRRPEM
ncbi:unnamed protein product [Closterium sp. NIES-54]